MPSERPAPSENQGRTGNTDPAEVIEARRLLMAEAERQIKPIDLFTIGTPADLAELRSAAQTIEPLLLALPHLFPPSTNLFDPRDLESPTIALPAIWRNFGTFQQMAARAETAAAATAAATDAEALKAAGRELRAACDGCHVVFTRPYEPPKVTQQDLDFDFEPFLPK